MMSRLEPGPVCCGDEGRADLGAFIASVYLQRYGAHTSHFAGRLLDLRGQDDPWCAALGYIRATVGGLFVERYPDRPLAAAVACLIQACTTAASGPPPIRIRSARSLRMPRCRLRAPARSAGPAPVRHRPLIVDLFLRIRVSNGSSQVGHGSKSASVHCSHSRPGAAICSYRPSAITSRPCSPRLARR